MQTRVKHLEKSALAESIGWIGTVGILSSYGLLSFGVISGNSVIYYLLSGVGAAGLAVVTYRHRAFQSFTVNTVFMVFALVALTRLAFFH